MSKKTKHSTNTIPENSITQEDLVALVENLCQDSINGPVDVIFRMREVYTQYHTATKDKVFVYDTNMPAVPFAQIATTDEI